MLHSLKPLPAKSAACAVPRRSGRQHTLQPAGNNHLLALDLGLKGGMALYGQDGRLRWYRSQHFASVTQLKRAAAHMMGTTQNLDWIISEGDYSLAAVWERAAMRQGVRVQRVSAQAWRQDLLPSSVPLRGAHTKKYAVALARRIVHWSDASSPTMLQHDAAEAILIGLWGVLRMGWLTQLPEALAPTALVQRVAGL